MTRTRVGRAALVGLCGAALGTCAPIEQRQGWECIAPAAAGGGWDLTCRLASSVMESLDVSPGRVRTINLPGAGGGIAFAHTVGERDQDERVLVAASPATTLRLAQGQFGRLNVSDVRWVAALGAEHGIVAVSADSPWSDLEDLMSFWSQDPSGIVVSGGSAVAGQDHMKMLLLARSAGIPVDAVRYVPFDGGGEAMTALLGGFVDVFAGEASEVEAQLESGDLKLLAVLAAERLPGSLSDVPTAAEQGFDVEWVTWRGFYVPAGIGDDAYRRWVEVLRLVGESDAWSAARVRARVQPLLILGDDFERFVNDQVEDFRELAEAMGLVS